MVHKTPDKTEPTLKAKATKAPLRRSGAFFLSKHSKNRTDVRSWPKNFTTSRKKKQELHNIYTNDAGRGYVFFVKPLNFP
jgi:hypothetical protein